MLEFGTPVDVTRISLKAKTDWFSKITELFFIFSSKPHPHSTLYRSGTGKDLIFFPLNLLEFVKASGNISAK